MLRMQTWENKSFIASFIMEDREWGEEILLEEEEEEESGKARV